MSAKTVEWLAVVIFFACFFALTLLESYWLNKKRGVKLGKSFAFSFATNIFTVTVGFSLLFVVLAALIMLISSEGSGIGPLGIGVAAAAGAATLLAASVLVKRLGLRIFRQDSAVRPWAFSLAASIIFLLIVISAPVLFIYFA